jgi:hypothetical protein
MMFFPALLLLFWHVAGGLVWRPGVHLAQPDLWQGVYVDVLSHFAPLAAVVALHPLYHNCCFSSAAAAATDDNALLLVLLWGLARPLVRLAPRHQAAVPAIRELVYGDLYLKCNWIAQIFGECWLMKIRKQELQQLGVIDKVGAAHLQGGTYMVRQSSPLFATVALHPV